MDERKGAFSGLANSNLLSDSILKLQTMKRQSPLWGGCIGTMLCLYIFICVFAIDADESDNCIGTKVLFFLLSAAVIVFLFVDYGLNGLNTEIVPLKLLFFYVLAAFGAANAHEYTNMHSKSCSKDYITKSSIASVVAIFIIGFLSWDNIGIPNWKFYSPREML